MFGATWGLNLPRRISFSFLNDLWLADRHFSTVVFSFKWVYNDILTPQVVPGLLLRMSFLPLSHFLRKKQAPTAPPTWIYSEVKSAKCFHPHALLVGWVGVIMWRWVDLHFVYQEFLPRSLGRRLCIRSVGGVPCLISCSLTVVCACTFLGNTHVLHG